MKRMFDATRLTELFVKAGLIAALAASLFAPMTVRVHGTEAPSEVLRPLPMLKQAAAGTLPLPQIPYLETMRWLLLPTGERGFKIDTLLAPQFELFGPAMAEPVSVGRPVVRSRPELAAVSRNG